MERLTDLDEMVLRCRTAQAADHLAEAVACYRAGAYRACIVATWVAVVYDLLDKVRDLALHGEARARDFVAEFTAIQDAHRRGDPDALRRSLDFERLVLDRVRDEFEMLTPAEHLDLARLREDRNRCAHPTVNQPDEAYRPTAELARLHLRSAVMHVLQQPPSQGKAALEALKRDFGSSYLPRREDEVLAFLKASPLARARDGLVKEVVGYLVGSFFDGHSGPPVADATTAIIAGVRRLYPVVADVELGRRIRAELAKLSDTHLFLAVTFMAEVPGAWQLLTEAQRTRLELYMRDGDAAQIAPVLTYAEKVEGLADAARKRIMLLNPNELEMVAVHGRGETVLQRALALLEKSSSWASSNGLIRKVVSPALATLTEQFVDELLRIAASNGEVRYATAYVRLIEAVEAQGVIPAERLRVLLKKHGLQDNDEEGEA